MHHVMTRKHRQCPESFLHVIEGGEGKAPLALPAGWKLEARKLSEERVFRGDSYQGPLAA